MGVEASVGGALPSDIARASCTAESWRVCGGESIQRFARASTESEVYVVAAECLSPAVAHELECLRHNVAKP
eukprot:scaffold293570_cov30-Tisochrysis_lutea.AAC.1